MYSSGKVKLEIKYSFERYNTPVDFCVDWKLWYQPERDGSLENYLSTRNGTSCVPVFHGYEIFEELKKIGALREGNGIRICLSPNFDESYIVTPDFKLEGLPGKFAGKPGIHEPRSILKKRNTIWELLQ